MRAVNQCVGVRVCAINQCGLVCVGGVCSLLTQQDIMVFIVGRVVVEGFCCVQSRGMFYVSIMSEQKCLLLNWNVRGLNNRARR